MRRMAVTAKLSRARGQPAGMVENITDGNARRRENPRLLEEEFEGVGRARTYYLDLAAHATPLPPRPKVTWFGQQRETLGVVLRALPYALGLRKRGGLRNLTPA